MKKALFLLVLSAFCANKSYTLQKHRDKSFGLLTANTACSLVKAILIKIETKLPIDKAAHIQAASSACGIVQGLILAAIPSSGQVTTGNAFAAGSLIANNFVSLLSHYQDKHGHVSIEAKQQNKMLLNTLLLSEIAASMLMQFSDVLGFNTSDRFDISMQNLIAALDACEKAVINDSIDNPTVWNNLELSLLAATAVVNLTSSVYYGCIEEKEQRVIKQKKKALIQFDSTKNEVINFEKSAQEDAAPQVCMMCFDSTIGYIAKTSTVIARISCECLTARRLSANINLSNKIQKRALKLSSGFYLDYSLNNFLIRIIKFSTASVTWVQPRTRNP
ncbi:hypothetical protein FJ364_06070 [Candidatus Dependentiae bacterium]|nr:hypothetical protein [Candidatus Dependentiae bacterium]